MVQCQQQDELKSGTVTATDKAEIAYTMQGHGDTTLLFIHGWCINKEYWSNQIDFFKNKYKVVAIDLPGFGTSSKSRTSWDFTQYAEDVHEVIRQLNLKQVILIGHSMSGDIILKTDNLYPDSNIGLIGIDNLHSPAGPKDSAYNAGAAQYYDQMEKGYDTTVTKFAKAYLFQPSTSDTVVNKVMKDVLSVNHKLSVDVLRSLEKIAQTEKTMAQRVSHPLCLVNSDVQPVQMDSLNKYYAKGVKVYYVHGTGHYPMIEKPDEFNLALQKAIWKE
jgi:pimeloyl-ACP methyl ester carboxylesterase